MSVATPVPDPGTPIFDARGYINPVWHQFFSTIWRRTGGGEGVDTESERLRIEALEYVSRDTAAESYGKVGASYAQPDPVPGMAVPTLPVLFDLPHERIAVHGYQDDPLLHSVATQQAAGFMSAGDKQKLDGVTSGAAVVSVTGSAPIQSSGGSNPNITIDPASATTAGSMSAADKSYLNTLGSFTNVSNVTDVTATNTNADVAFLSAAVAANTVQAGRAFRVTVFGQLSGAASGGTISFFIKVSGTRIAQVQVTLPASAISAQGFLIEASVIYRTVGASGTVQVGMSLVGSSSFVTGAITGYGLAGVNTTTAGQIDVGANWSAASASNIATAKNAVISMEKV